MEGFYISSKLVKRQQEYTVVTSIYDEILRAITKKDNTTRNPTDK